MIGSNRQKSLAVKYGVLPRLITLLTKPPGDLNIRREACIVLGSIVKGTIENVRAVVDAGTVPVLLNGEPYKKLSTVWNL